MGKKGKCLADGAVGPDGLTEAQRAKRNAALQSLGMSTAQPPVQSPPAMPQPVPVTPPAEPDRPRGIMGILGGRGKQIDKASGYANGGIINNAAEYWANDNAEFEKTNPNIGSRLVRAINPVTGFGSAMGAMHTAAGNGDVPGMAMAGISAIPAFGVMRMVPAAGAMKAYAVPDVARSAAAVAGQGVYNAASDEYQARQNPAYARGGIVRGKGGVDRVPMAIGGVNVNLTGGKKPEAVLPGKTVEALGGPQAVEQLIEDTNGKPPVRDGLKAGGKYGDGLVVNEDDPRLRPYGATAPQLGSGLYGSTGISDTKPAGVPSANSFSNGRDATGLITGDSAQSMSSAPMQRPGGISGSIDMAGVNGILSRENKARGEMIDSMVRASGGNGGATIGEVAPGKTQNDLDNAEKTARWRQEDLIGKLGRGYDGAIAAAITANARSADVAGTNAAQLQSAELQNQTARYGHDVNALRTAESNRIQMRGQDLAASEAAARTGIDRERLGITREDSARAGERFGLEKTKTQGEIDDQRAMRDARSGLVSALASGDSNAINAARAKATAAGLKFDHPQQEFVTATDSMGMNVTRTNKGTGAIDIIDGKTGKVKASIPGQGAPAAAQAPIPPGHTLIGTSGGKRVFKDAQGNRFVEGN